MTAEIIEAFKFQDLVSPQAATQALRRVTILNSITNIENNLSDENIHILKRALLKWLDMGSMLCVLQNREVDYLIGMLEQEKLYRENHCEVL
jgi:hypothetical protein